MMLSDAARDLRNRVYDEAGMYLEKQARLLLSFAELALEDVEVPFR